MKLIKSHKIPYNQLNNEEYRKFTYTKIGIRSKSTNTDIFISTKINNLSTLYPVLKKS
jgi:hypothetical protein